MTGMTETRPTQSPRLPKSLATMAGLSRRLIQHPMAITTVDAFFRADVAVQAGGPWWNRRAVDYLSAYLRRGDQVFEWGSGGSTTWLVALGAQVTSIEHDQEWVARVSKRCPKADVRAIPGAATGTLADEMTPVDDECRFFDDYVAAIDEFPDETFAAVIVDGMCRPACLRRATSKVRPGGLIIVDDTDMRPYRPLKKSLPGWKTVSLAGFKPTRDLRETTFFHRPW